MKKTVFLLLLMLVATTLAAQESRTAYNFLRLPTSAHAAALGGDNVTLVEDDAMLTFHNPALLSSVSDKTIGLGAMSYMEGSVAASAAFNRVVGERASWAATAQYVDYGTMKQTDADNRQLGEFSAKDIAIAGTFAYELSQRLVGGISARIVNSNIADYHSWAVGIDLGLNYYDPAREWSLSLVAKNLGGQLKAYDEEFERMPVDVQAGVTKRVTNAPFRLSATLVDLNHLDYKFIHHVVAGIDILLSSTMWVGCGYNFRRAHEMTISSSDDEESSHGAGFSLGAGLQLQRLKLNLAYGKYHVASSSLMFNIAYSL